MKGPNAVTITIFVDGEKNEFSFSSRESVQSVIAQVVGKLHLNQGPDQYQLMWFSSGTPLDPHQSLLEAGVTDGSVLVLSPRAGIGG